jgi:hypothetical protein
MPPIATTPDEFFTVFITSDFGEVIEVETFPSLSEAIDLAASLTGWVSRKEASPP